MLQGLIGLVVLSFLGLFVVAAVFVVGMRYRWPLVIDTVRRLNRRFLNPKQMRTAGSVGAYASILRHVGRVSGTLYETPLSAIGTDDGFVIALVYGARTGWLKNVLASGTATIVDEGVVYELDRPEVIPIAEEALRFSPSDRRSQRILGVDSALRLRHVEAQRQGDVQ